MVLPLLRLLGLEALGSDRFLGSSAEYPSRKTMFGGHVAAQALAGAGRTVSSSRVVHKLHADFLRAGRSGDDTPIVYTVDRLHDGRSFSTRRVVADQGDRTLLQLTASFATEQSGPQYQGVCPPEVLKHPPPARDEGRRSWLASSSQQLASSAGIELRPVSRHEPELGESTRAQVWIRIPAWLEADALAQRCLALYASDLALLRVIGLPHATREGQEIGMASVNHTVWFHQPLHADQWCLYDLSCPSTSGGRGLALGRLFSGDGSLAISVAQEGVFL